MIACRFCESSSQDFYLFTNCRHLICTVCAFQKANFSLQTIQCCDNQTTINEQSMTVIIKSRKSKKSPISINSQIKQDKNYIASSNEHNCNEPFLIKNQLLKRDSTIMDEYEPSQLSCYKNSRAYVAEKQVVIEQQRCQLEKMLLKQMQRIKQQFDIEHEKLRIKEKSMINQLLSTYEQQVKSIFNNKGSDLSVKCTPKIDAVQEGASLRHTARNLIKIDSSSLQIEDTTKKVDNLSMKMSSYSLKIAEPKDRQADVRSIYQQKRKTARHEVDSHLKQSKQNNPSINHKNNVPDKHVSNDISRSKADQWDQQWLTETKKNNIEYDYILKRLEINQQRMNQKLQRHAHVC